VCGIIGVIAPNAAELIADGLKALQYRGYDSAGIAMLDGNRLEVLKEIGKPELVAESLGFALRPGNIGIGHVRWATHGGVTDYNAHPHWACTADFVVVHNGIIENWEELKAGLVGHKFSSECDSEVIAHLLEEETSPFLEERMSVVQKKLKGSWAIATMWRKDPCIVGCRKGSPLYVGVSSEGVSFLASDALAFPEKGVFSILEEEMVVRLDNGGLWRTKDYKYPKMESYSSQEKVTYNPQKHFMLKEIYEEGKILNYDIDLKLWSNPNHNPFKRILLLGCGSSRYSCLMGYYFLLDADITSEVVMPSETEHFVMLCDKDTLVIAVSQSGETADVLEAVRIAKGKGAKVLGIVNREHSLLENLSDETVHLNLGPERAVAATKSFLAQVHFFLELSMWIQQTGYPLTPGIKASWSIGKNEETIRKLAKELQDKEHVYYIGKGPWFSLACEGALKLKEVAYIHAEAFRSGELKHGSLALIEQGTPVIALCLEESTVISATEAKARGARIIGISPKNESCFDVWLEAKDWVEATPVLHLLAYYTGVAKGINVDMPRNLAKSCTVR